MSKHQAGRELDALVAEKVMGWVWLKMPGSGREASFMPPERVAEMLPEYVAANRRDGYNGFWPNALPRYSTDIAAAWDVVEHCQRVLDGGGRWYFTADSVVCGGWMVRVFDERRWMEECDGDTCWPASEYGDTAPLAICLAALEAVGSSSPTPEPSDR